MFGRSQPQNTFGEVLRVVEVDLAEAAVRLHQVVLGAAQVDLTVLETKHGKKTKQTGGFETLVTCLNSTIPLNPSR